MSETEEDLGKKNGKSNGMIKDIKRNVTSNTIKSKVSMMMRQGSETILEKSRKVPVNLTSLANSTQRSPRGFKS